VRSRLSFRTWTAKRTSLTALRRAARASNQSTSHSRPSRTWKPETASRPGRRYLPYAWPSMPSPTTSPASLHLGPNPGEGDPVRGCLRAMGQKKAT
jgi:hypothetical protein